MSGRLCAALLTLAASGTLHPVAGQNANDRLAAARAQLHAMRFDSAAVLLRGTLDASDHAEPEEQAEALQLLGVIAFYKGDDSGAAGAFRHALALDPLLKSDGVARYDSALVVLFEAQRSVAMRDTRDSRPPGARTGEVADCTRTCPEGLVLPSLMGLEALEGLVPDRFELQHHRYGMMTFDLMVDAAGHVVPESVHLVASNLEMKPLEQALLRGMERALFTPARGPNGARVSVIVRGKLGFRNDRFEEEVPVVPRRRPR